MNPSLSRRRVDTPITSARYVQKTVAEFTAVGRCWPRGRQVF